MARGGRIDGLMNQLLKFVSLAIAALKSRAEHVLQLEQQATEKDQLIADLKAKLVEAQVQDDALLQRATAAEQSVADLQSVKEQADQAAAELANALNESAEVPSVNPTTFEITAPAQDAPQS